MAPLKTQTSSLNHNHFSFDSGQQIQREKAKLFFPNEKFSKEHKIETAFVFFFFFCSFFMLLHKRKFSYCYSLGKIQFLVNFLVVFIIILSSRKSFSFAFCQVTTLKELRRLNFFSLFASNFYPIAERKRF